MPLCHQSTNVNDQNYNQRERISSQYGEALWTFLRQIPCAFIGDHVDS